MNKYQEITSLPITDLLAICEQHRSIRKVMFSFGVKNDTRIRAYIRKVATDAGSICFEHHNEHRRTYTAADIQNAVATSECWADVARAVGLSPVSGNTTTVKRLVSKHGFDTSHFDVEKARQRNKTRWTVATALVEHSKYPRSNLGSFVKNHKLFIYKCVSCANEGSWNGVELRLELDHINGISDDNRIENLRWLCPNCHSQTETFGGNRRKLAPKV